MLRIRFCFTLAAVTLAAGVLAMASARAQVPVQDRQPAGAALRPAVAGPSGGVSTGHPLTTAAAFATLLKGGNAFDAGVTALLVGGVVEQDLYSLGGEALVLVYPQKDKTVTSIVGQGWAPKAVDVDWYLSRGKSLEGSGLDPAVTPGALHAALTVLEKWGTMTFEQVAAPAIEYAAKGFPLRTSTARSIVNQKKLFDQWPDNQKYWHKADGSHVQGWRHDQTADAGAHVDAHGRGRTRREGQGPRGRHRRRPRSLLQGRHREGDGGVPAEARGAIRPVRLLGVLRARSNRPPRSRYRGYTVYKHGFGSQGPMLLQTLNILEQFDLKAMGYDSADYLHTVTEAMKLAYADRDTYYADPAFVQVPAEGLLSKAYARERAALIDPRSRLEGLHRRRSAEARLEGEAVDVLEGRCEGRHGPLGARGDVSLANQLASRGLDSAGVSKDTTHIAIVDKDGNVFDSTPSGGWVNGAVILGDTGIGMSVRGEQFFLDTARANQIRPRARPRYTLTPSLVFKDGTPLMALGTPGGDNQDQTILQAFLSIVEFWDAWYPNLHAALERPRVQTLHFLGSFWPHEGGFNKLNVEAAIPDDVFTALKARGHDVSRIRTFGMSGCATAVLIDPASGNRIAGADPRRDCYAIAY